LATPANAARRPDDRGDRRQEHRQQQERQQQRRDEDAREQQDRQQEGEERERQHAAHRQHAGNRGYHVPAWAPLVYVHGGLLVTSGLISSFTPMTRQATRM
jgi:hypothetical protein